MKSPRLRGDTPALRLARHHWLMRRAARCRHRSHPSPCGLAGRCDYGKGVLALDPATGVGVWVAYLDDCKRCEELPR